MMPAEHILTPVPADQYPRGVAAAVLLSLENASAGPGGDLRVAVMDLIAVLSPGGVPRRLLHTAAQSGHLSGLQIPGPVTQADLDAALGYLARMSLITFSVDDTSVTAHRLVLRVTRERLARQERLPAACLAAARTVEDLNRPLSGRPDRDPVLTLNMFDQVDALSANAPPGRHESDQELCHIIGLLQNQQGPFERIMAEFRTI